MSPHNLAVSLTLSLALPHSFSVSLCVASCRPLHPVPLSAACHFLSLPLNYVDWQQFVITWNEFVVVTSAAHLTAFSIPPFLSPWSQPWSNPRPHALTKNMSIKTNKLTLNEKIKCLSLQFVVCPQPFGSPRHETKERPSSPALHPSVFPSFVETLARIVNQATTLLLRLCNWQNSFRPQSSARIVCETVPQSLAQVSFIYAPFEVRFELCLRILEKVCK